MYTNRLDAGSLPYTANPVNFCVYTLIDFFNIHTFLSPSRHLSIVYTHSSLRRDISTSYTQTFLSLSRHLSMASLHRIELPLGHRSGSQGARSHKSRYRAQQRQMSVPHPTMPDSAHFRPWQCSAVIACVFPASGGGYTPTPFCFVLGLSTPISYQLRRCIHTVVILSLLKKHNQQQIVHSQSPGPPPLTLIPRYNSVLDHCISTSSSLHCAARPLYFYQQQLALRGEAIVFPPAPACTAQRGHRISTSSSLHCAARPSCFHQH